MRKMTSVLLVFDDLKEVEFIEANLIENCFNVYIAENLNAALILVEKHTPELIVINTCDSQGALRLFSNQIKTERLKNMVVLSLIETEIFMTSSAKEYYLVKPVRPKVLLSLIRSVMSLEEIKWFPFFAHQS